MRSCAFNQGVLHAATDAVHHHTEQLWTDSFKRISHGRASSIIDDVVSS
jgi:hypothetical protein